MAASPDVRSERRRRPKDRKEQIARVSADAFSELGYHGVSMEGIAGRVGVSAASLYRHYAGKYELFRDAVLALGNLALAVMPLEREAVELTVAGSPVREHPLRGGLARP